MSASRKIALVAVVVLATMLLISIVTLVLWKSDGGEPRQAPLATSTQP